MYGFIYITTNHVNGKKYIGQKNYDKHNKWKDYLGSGIHLKRAISKYGKENFSKEIIEECETKDKLNEQEKYWISYYNAVESDNFYNIAPGGDGGNVVSGYSENDYQDYQKRRLDALSKSIKVGEESASSKLTECQVIEIIDRLKNNEFNSDIAKYYNVSSGTIDCIRQHKTWKYLTKDIIFDDISNRKRASKKSVDIYDLSGTFIDTVQSAREAEQKYNIPHKNVSQVCKGEKRQSHGYICRFHGESFDKYNVENTNQVKVDKYDLFGNYIETFDSILEANNAVGIKSIGAVINGKTKSAGGFYWVKHGEQFSFPEYQRNLSNTCVIDEMMA